MALKVQETFRVIVNVKVYRKEYSIVDLQNVLDVFNECNLECMECTIEKIAKGDDY